MAKASNSGTSACGVDRLANRSVCVLLFFFRTFSAAPVRLPPGFLSSNYFRVAIIVAICTGTERQPFLECIVQPVEGSRVMQENDRPVKLAYIVTPNLVAYLVAPGQSFLWTDI